MIFHMYKCRTAVVNHTLSHWLNRDWLHLGGDIVINAYEFSTIPHKCNVYIGIMTTISKKCKESVMLHLYVSTETTVGINETLYNNLRCP